MPETPTPDTLSYLIGGLAVIFVVMGLLIVSMVARWQNLNRDIHLIEQLRDDR
jgi:hypothetical protein